MCRGKSIVVVVLALMLVIASGMVYGEESPVARDRSVAQILQLPKDIRMLRAINELELSKEQIDKLLPVLKSWREVITSIQREVLAILQAQKAALLKGESIEVNREGLQRRAAIRRQEIKVDAENIKLQLMKILTPEQLQKMQRLFAPVAIGKPGNGMLNKEVGVVERSQLGKAGAFRNWQQVQKRVENALRARVNQRKEEGVSVDDKPVAAPKGITENLRSSARGRYLKDRLSENAAAFSNGIKGLFQRRVAANRGAAARVNLILGSEINKVQMFNDFIRLLEEKLAVLTQMERASAVRGALLKGDVLERANAVKQEILNRDVVSDKVKAEGE